MVIYTIKINKDYRQMSITVLLNTADEFILHVDDFLLLGTKNKPTAKKDSKINVTKVLLADVDFVMVIPFTYSFHYQIVSNGMVIVWNDPVLVTILGIDFAMSLKFGIFLEIAEKEICFTFFFCFVTLDKKLRMLLHEGRNSMTGIIRS